MTIEELTQEMMKLRERVAVLEARDARRMAPNWAPLGPTFHPPFEVTCSDNPH